MEEKEDFKIFIKLKKEIIGYDFKKKKLFVFIVIYINIFSYNQWIFCFIHKILKYLSGV